MFCGNVYYRGRCVFVGRGGVLARGSVFRARFLWAWPESTQVTRQDQEPDYRMAGLAGFNARITQLLTEPMPFDETGNGLSPAMLELSPEAKDVWIKVSNLVETAIAQLGRDRESVG